MQKNLNTHIAYNRDYYLNKIEADFPMTLTIGTKGETKTFDNGEENDFFDWLLQSKKAIYLWRGCVDVMAIAVMFQMDIDCIIYSEGTVPAVVKLMIGL